MESQLTASELESELETLFADESSSDEEDVDDTKRNKYDSDVSGMGHEETVQAEFFHVITQSQTAFRYENLLSRGLFSFSNNLLRVS